MELLQLGKEPVSADQPTGADVRYEPEFDNLQAEIDKLSSPSATEATDWKKVMEIASGILAEKSKDILVAGYLAVSQIHLNNIQGLETGLTIYGDLLETFWEDLFPKKKRMRGRIGAVDWWIEKSQTALGLIKPSPIPQEKKQSLLALLDKIDKLFIEYLEEPPFIRDLQRAIEALPAKAEQKPAPAEPERTAEPQPQAPAQTTPSTATTAPAAQPQPVAPQPVAQDMANEADAQKIITTSLQNIRKAAGFVRNSNPANSLVYRFTRMAIWGQIEALPMATDGVKTIIPGPDQQALAALTDLRARGDYANLLTFAENKITEFVFWLDLNRCSSEALAGLGGPYEKAREAVCQETSYLLQRLPGLENYQFADGTPFADTNTKAWLKEIGFSDVSAVMAPMTVVSTDADSQREDVMSVRISDAQTLVKQKELPEAVDLLQNSLRASFSQRETMLWRLALSQILITAKKAKMAVPHLEQILREIEEFKLEQWEPELALKGLKVILTGFKAHSDAGIKARAEDIVGRIARLDAVEGLKIG